MKSFLVVGLAVLLSSANASADIFMEIDGQRQGRFPGESLVRGFERKQLVESLNHEVMIPTDSRTGQATGKRTHKPVTITRQFGAATTALYQALVNNELLRTVTLGFYRLSPRAGQTELFFSIKLNNASIVGMRTMSASSQGGSSIPVVEEVTFVYESIEIKNELTGAVVIDSWK